MYLDETGFDRTVYRPYGWGRLGCRVRGFRSGQRRPRTSLVAGWIACTKTLIAPLLFEGTTNTLMFNAWLREGLLPELPANSVVVMDNAAFHTSQETKDILLKAGHTLLYLPPYSPDLNPIEKVWATLKKIWQNSNGGTLDDTVAMFNPN